MERDAEFIALQQEVTRLRDQLRDLRLTVATLHPEFFSEDKPPPRRHLRVVDCMGVGVVVLFIARRAVKPAAVVAALGTATAALVIAVTAVPSAQPQRGAEPAPQAQGQAAAGHGRRSARAHRGTSRPSPSRPPSGRPSPRPVSAPPRPAPPPAAPRPAPRPSPAPSCVVLLGVRACLPDADDVSGMSAARAVGRGKAGCVAVPMRLAYPAPDLRVRPIDGVEAPAIGLEPITCRVAGARAPTWKDAVASLKLSAECQQRENWRQKWQAKVTPALLRCGWSWRG